MTITGREVRYLSAAGEVLTFSNRDGLYPVNEYQSLVLAQAGELAASMVAMRQKRHLADLAAWEPCCGGGPAAVSLKRAGVGFVRASDVNQDCVDGCSENAALNGVTLDDARVIDLLDDGEQERQFDLIVCNPPCFPGLVPEEPLDGDVTAQEVAIRGGPDGMQLTLEFLASALPRIREGGSLVFVCVSTGNIQRLAAILDKICPKRWRTFPGSPIAAPYVTKENPRSRILTDGSLPYRPLIWLRSDGWYWRLSWVVEVVSRNSSFSADVWNARNVRSGFTLHPYGYDVSRDPNLAEMIETCSQDGFWLQTECS